MSMSDHAIVSSLARMASERWWFGAVSRNACRVVRNGGGVMQSGMKRSAISPLVWVLLQLDVQSLIHIYRIDGAKASVPFRALGFVGMY